MTLTISTQEFTLVSSAYCIEYLRGHRRGVQCFTLEMPYDLASQLFVDGSVYEVTDSRGITKYTDFGVAGPITDNRDGTIIVKMGRNNNTEQDLADKVSEVTAMLTTITGPNKVSAEQVRRLVEVGADTLTDEEAVAVPSLSKAWAVGEAVTPGMRRYYDPTGRLYKCVQGHTTQADWTPDKTPALWAVVDAAHAGTQDDPIPAARGMEYIYGKYYSDPEDGKVYLCTRQGTSPGQTVTLQYLPHELIGHYFAAAA